MTMLSHSIMALQHHIHKHRLFMPCKHSDNTLPGYWCCLLRCGCPAGACPKSYGTNVARLAGLPASVVSRAATMSASREALAAGGSKPAAPAVGPDMMDVDEQQPGGGSAATGATAAAAGDKGAADVQEMIGSIYKQLQQLKAAGGDAAGVAQVTELQRQAAVLCK